MFYMKCNCEVEEKACSLMKDTVFILIDVPGGVTF